MWDTGDRFLYSNANEIKIYYLSDKYFQLIHNYQASHSWRWHNDEVRMMTAREFYKTVEISKHKRAAVSWF